MKEILRTNASDTVIGENVKVTGKLHTTGSIQINGKVKGEVSSEGGVVVGKSASISGPIQAKSVKVEGEVKGNISAETDLEIEGSAKVFGDILTKSLSIKSGAVFVGKSTMLEAEEKVEKEGKKKEEKGKEEKKEPELELEIE